MPAPGLGRTSAQRDAYQVVTVTPNIILLVAVPWGTAVGIYGLWKVDKG